MGVPLLTLLGLALILPLAMVDSWMARRREEARGRTRSERVVTAAPAPADAAANTSMQDAA